MSVITEIKERPIPFKADMVRAILEGKKTQTRRLIDWPEWADTISDESWRPPHIVNFREDMGEREEEKLCPYGVPGDRLWVRETWEPLEFSDREIGVLYSATPHGNTRDENQIHWHSVGEEEAAKWMRRSGKRFPSIHMPRWASRITLEITGVRAEPIQEISEEDAALEGVHQYGDEKCWKIYTPTTSFGCSSARRSFESLWDSLVSGWANSWESNPWVWVVEFKRITE